MTQSTFQWNKTTCESSISAQCWWFTPYDAGWDKCTKYGGDIAADEELREIVRMELEAGPIPDWAREWVRVSVHLPAPCGHCSFPEPCLEAVSAIGSGQLPGHIHGCYTADGDRKRRMQNYVLCLDAWLKGAAPPDVVPELASNGREGVDWEQVCASLWEVLGEPTELKRLLVERTRHRYRWWVKTMTWDDDARDRFEQDVYLGDIRGSGDTYGDPAFKDPYTSELESPEAKRIEDALSNLDGDWQSKFGNIHETWLCGPKSFRSLERILWAIGKERPIADGESVPGFLQCQDTMPDRGQASAWWRAFLAALDAWWQDAGAGGPVADGALSRDVHARLGSPTPVKRWLVRLYARRLRMLAQGGILGRLVNPAQQAG